MSTTEPIRDFYFVFGTRYREDLHPVFSTYDLPEHYVTVEAPTEWQARERMNALCGSRWSRCLTHIPRGYFKKGELRRIRWDDIIAGGAVLEDAPAAEQPVYSPPEKSYGHSVTIGQHEVTSWPARVEDDTLINDAAVQVAFRGVEVMVYASTVDGRTVVEVTQNGDGQFRVVTGDGDPVHTNYTPAGD